MTNSTNSPPQPRRRQRLDQEAIDPHGEIGKRLRALYCEAEQEPIPDALIALLEKLDEAEAKNTP